MTYQSLTPERIALEWKALQGHLPPHSYQLCDMGSDAPYALITVTTKAAKDYTMRFELCGFPQNPPDVIIDQSLLDKDGNRLDKAKMHAFNDENGRTHLCLYKEEEWRTNISLSQVVVKSRLWLEMYHRHLQSGEDIDYLLTLPFSTYS